MQLSRRLRIVLVGSSGCLLVIIYVPILLIMLYAFNPSKSQKWPVTGLTLQWIQAAIGNPGARSALLLSVQVGLVATAIALVLGSLLSAAVHRHRFFGRNVGVVPGHPSGRAPRHRHRDRAEHDVPDASSAASACSP